MGRGAQPEIAEQQPNLAKTSDASEAADASERFTSEHPEIRSLLSERPQTGPRENVQEPDTISFDVSDPYRPEESAALIDTEEGDDSRIKVAESSPGTKELGESRSDLLSGMKETIKDPETRARFMHNMARFEQRDDISAEEKGRTYEEIGKLFKNNPDAPLDEQTRAKLAGNVMRLAASPHSVDQGISNTCVTASLESRVYAKYPSRAASLVAEVANTGTFTDSTGKPISIDDGSLMPDQFNGKEPPPDGKRSHASQIFQVTAVNAIYKHSSGRQSHVFEQHPPQEGDNGEKVYDTANGDKKLIAEGNPSLDSTDKVLAHKLITGESGDHAILDRGDDFDEKTGSFTSETELGKLLAKLKADGELPALIGVNAGNEPFYSDHKIGSFGLTDGGHALSITDYDPATGEVKVDNQWGKDKDHIDKPISLKNLYAATLNPEEAWDYKLNHRIESEFPGLSHYQKQIKQQSLILDESPKARDNNGLRAGLIFARSDDTRKWGDGPDDIAESEKLMGEVLDKFSDKEALTALNTRFEMSYSNDNSGGSERYRGFETAFDTSREFYSTNFLKAANNVGLTRKDIEAALPTHLESREPRLSGVPEDQVTLHQAANFLSKLSPTERERLLSRIEKL